MQPTSDLRLIAERMLMVESILSAFANGRMPMHATGYQQLATWAGESFRAIDSGALRTLRDAAPRELRGIVENVLHERRVVSWTVDEAVALSALAVSLSLFDRCRNRR